MGFAQSHAGEMDMRIHDGRGQVQWLRMVDGMRWVVSLCRQSQGSIDVARMAIVHFFGAVVEKLAFQVVVPFLPHFPRVGVGEEMDPFRIASSLVCVEAAAGKGCPQILIY